MVLKSRTTLDIMFADIICHVFLIYCHLVSSFALCRHLVVSFVMCRPLVLSFVMWRPLMIVFAMWRHLVIASVMCRPLMSTFVIYHRLKLPSPCVVLWRGRYYSAHFLTFLCKFQAPECQCTLHNSFSMAFNNAEKRKVSCSTLCLLFRFV